MQQLMKVDDLAKVFAVSKTTIMRWERRGHIPRARRINARSIRWLSSEIEEFLYKADDTEQLTERFESRATV